VEEEVLDTQEQVLEVLEVEEHQELEHQVQEEVLVQLTLEVEEEVEQVLVHKLEEQEGLVLL
jgi:chemotaxis regulatin CheY-phosphate phosphatase CheZ